MTAHQAALFDQARRALQSAWLTLHDGDVRAAINRAYYAATAALQGEGEAPDSHKGVHRRFHLHFIKSGRLETSQGKLLKFAFDLRQRADYEAFTIFDEAAAADLITDAETFVEAVEALLTTDGN